MANNVNVENKNLLYGCFPELEHNHPWLVITHGERFEKQTFYSIMEDRHFTKEIPEMRNKHISQTSYGWLMLMDDDDLACYLINPKTMEIIQLPQVVKHDVYRCVLSKPPTERDCQILLLGDGNSILFCRIGDSKFIERPIQIDGHTMTSVTNFRGEIFAWTNEASFAGVAIVDFVNGDILLRNLVKKNGHLCRIPWSKLSPKGYEFFHDQLIESCDELFLVHLIYCPAHLDVSSYRIFKFDMSEMEWQELHNIGNCAIFLSRYGGMAMSPTKELRIETDSIYYINNLHNDKNLYQYHIKDRSQTMLLPYREVDGVNSIKSWIMI